MRMATDPVASGAHQSALGKDGTRPHRGAGTDVEEHGPPELHRRREPFDTALGPRAHS
jgi:hypothetical protein